MTLFGVRQAKDLRLRDALPEPRLGAVAVDGKVPLRFMSPQAKPGATRSRNKAVELRNIADPTHPEVVVCHISGLEFLKTGYASKTPPSQPGGCMSPPTPKLLWEILH